MISNFKWKMENGGVIPPYCQSFPVVINYHKTSTYESEDTP